MLIDHECLSLFFESRRLGILFGMVFAILDAVRPVHVGCFDWVNRGNPSRVVFDISRRFVISPTSRTRSYTLRKL